MLKVHDLPTPSLLLDTSIMERNIRRMSDRIGALGCVLRPHVKTHKSLDVTQRIVAAGNVRGITVSTLSEAEHFFAGGHTDVLYAVGIAPGKLEHIASLISRGCELRIILDNAEAAGAVVDAGEKLGVCFQALVELDVDGHRSGVAPDDPLLLDIARRLQSSPHTAFLGVMTHAGGSYGCTTSEALLMAARQERDHTLLAVERLRAAGIACPIVSIGSTPTALSVDDLSGITEVRAGVYTFFDLVQTGIGVCDVDDIAISVLASVIGHQSAKGWAIIDAGWTALSRDRGTASQAVDYGYGAVMDAKGQRLQGLIVSQTNQEHAVVARPPNTLGADPTALHVGDRVRVLPNHACAMAGQHECYHVIDGEDVIAQWARI